MTKLNKTSYPRFHIEFTLNGKPINSLSTKKSLRILYRIRLSESKFKWDKAYLRFNYNKKSINEGYCFNLKELKSTYRCFMEIVPEYQKDR
jgi:hypothetical protein